MIVTQQRSGQRQSYKAFRTEIWALYGGSGCGAVFVVLSFHLPDPNGGRTDATRIEGRRTDEGFAAAAAGRQKLFPLARSSPLPLSLPKSSLSLESESGEILAYLGKAAADTELP